MKISVIMPVYNASASLPRSLESLRKQTFRDFEVVFVDDGSTDGSANLLAAFQEQADIPCQILRQGENQGVAAARNRGLDAAGGEWVTFVDADDTIEEKALETALQAAAPGVDLVGWDWILGFEKNGRTMRQADYPTALGALKNLMGGTMRWNLWLFLFRRDLLESSHIRFIDGADMGEDMLLTIQAFLHAREVVQVHAPLYRYNAVSTSSLSRQFSPERRQEVTTNIQAVEAAVRSSRYRQDLADYLPFLKLYVKLPLLVSTDRADYETWYAWFPESNPCALRNKALPLRTRLLQGMAARRLWAGVRLYHLLVYQLVYGLIYR